MAKSDMVHFSGEYSNAWLTAIPNILGKYFDVFKVFKVESQLMRWDVLWVVLAAVSFHPVLRSVSNLHHCMDTGGHTS